MLVTAPIALFELVVLYLVFIVGNATSAGLGDSPAAAAKARAISNALNSDGIWGLLLLPGQGVLDFDGLTIAVLAVAFASMVGAATLRSGSDLLSTVVWGLVAALPVPIWLVVVLPLAVLVSLMELVGSGTQAPMYWAGVLAGALYCAMMNIGTWGARLVAAIWGHGAAVRRR
jgi:hypothetical protein